MDQHPSLPQLLTEFHSAIELFHQSRIEWESTLSASEFRHQERVDTARQKLNDAERTVEELEKKITEAISRPN